MRRRRGLNHFRRPNPLTGKEDLALAGLGLVIVGAVGWALYSKLSAPAGTTANPNVSTWSQTQQSAYDNWVMQQIQAGNVTPAQASAGG